MTELAVTQYFTYWRNIELGSREILEGLVAREHAAPSPALARRLADWDGYHYWQNTVEGRWLVLVHEDARPHERWWLHGALFLVTLVATSIAGAAFAGVGGTWYLPTLAQIRAGLPFSLPLMAILLAHESGHYVMARYYRVNASPPYFIPSPPFNIIGTLGAFIRLRSPIFDRRTLFDIGIAGPLAGLVVAVPVLLVGLVLSAPQPGAPAHWLAHQFIPFDNGYALFGDSLLMAAARLALGIHGPVMLHPIAIAGWVGILFTSLNLLPLTQLDGGHVAFALLGRAQRWIAIAFVAMLIPLGRLWIGWWLWVVLAFALGRGRLGHPPVIAPERALDPTRRLIGWIGLALFVATFMPLPLLLVF